MDETKTTPTAQPGANPDPEKKPGAVAANTDDAGAIPPAGGPGPGRGPGPDGSSNLDKNGLQAALAAYIAATQQKGDSSAPSAPAANADSGCQRKDEDPGNNVLKEIVARRDLMEDGQAKSDINTLISMLEAATARADVAEEAAKPSAESGTDAMNHDGADVVDAKVRQRVELILLGQRLNLDGMDTLPVDAAKKKVIGAVLPGMRLDGKSSAYIEAAYDMAREKAQARKTVDEQRQQVFNADSANSAANTGTKYDPEKSRNNMIRRHAGEEA